MAMYIPIDTVLFGGIEHNRIKVNIQHKNNGFYLNMKTVLIEEQNPKIAISVPNKSPEVSLLVYPTKKYNERTEKILKSQMKKSLREQSGSFYNFLLNFKKEIQQQQNQLQSMILAHDLLNDPKFLQEFAQSLSEEPQEIFA